MIYLIHGEEEFLRSGALQKLKASLGEPEMASLNTTVLDGQKVTLSELQAACDTVPFLAPRRLVIVESLIHRLEGPQAKGSAESHAEFLQGLLDYLGHVPETTDLALVEPQVVSNRSHLFKAVQDSQKHRRGDVITCVAPKGTGLTRWIQEQALIKKGRISLAAAEVLSQVVGDNLRLLDRELEKLVAYSSKRRDISPDDVRLLVPEAREVEIWDMVDALALGEGQQATIAMHRMLDEGEHPLRMLAMIVRQYRLLLQVKELIARGLRPHEISKKLRLHSYPTEKMIRQSRRYSLAQLESIFEQLLETDLDIKTGRMDAVLALDVLVAELSSPHEARPGRAA